MNRGHIYNCFIFFRNYEWAQKARVLHFTRPKMLARGKLFSLLGLFESYEENNCYEYGPWMFK